MRFHQSILSFENGRYRKVALVLSAASIAIYVWYEPPLPHPKAYGGTWVGYLLGIAAALLILWLLVLGVRKRAYQSTLGSAEQARDASVTPGARGGAVRCPDGRGRGAAPGNAPVPPWAQPVGTVEKRPLLRIPKLR